MLNDVRVSRLEKKVNSAIGVFTKAIDKLEKANKEYDTLQVEVNGKIDSLTSMSAGISRKMAQNENLLSNLRGIVK